MLNQAVSQQHARIDASQSPDSSERAPVPLTDEASLLKQAADELASKDPILGTLISTTGYLKPLNTSGSLFAHLAHAIVGQQVSVAAAKAVWNRILDHCGKPLTPEKILASDADGLRSCGCSERKAGYIRTLAERIKDKKLPVRSLHRLSDEDVAKHLVALPGIGPWTVEMCLMFRLNRPDVFSYGDLGLRRAIEKLYGLDPTLKPREFKEQAQPIVDNWSPHRTLASRYLWTVIDTVPW